MCVCVCAVHALRRSHNTTRVRAALARTLSASSFVGSHQGFWHVVAGRKDATLCARLHPPCAGVSVCLSVCLCVWLAGLQSLVFVRLAICIVKTLNSMRICTLSARRCVAVCRSVLQCVAVCCSVLQCVAVCCSVLVCLVCLSDCLKCITMCRSVLQCVAVCCSVSQCVAVCRSVSQCVAVCCSVLQCVAVCFSV